MENISIDSIVSKLEIMDKKLDKLVSLFDENKQQIKTQSIINTESVVVAGIDRFVKALQISPDKLRTIFEFEDNDLHLLESIEGKNVGEAQVKTSLCIMTAYHFYFNQGELKSKELSKKLKMLGIGALQNLSTNIKSYKNYFIPKGTAGSNNFAYKITYVGIQEGINLIKQLIKEE